LGLSHKYLYYNIYRYAWLVSQWTFSRAPHLLLLPCLYIRQSPLDCQWRHYVLGLSVCHVQLFGYSFWQIWLPQYFVNGLNNFDKLKRIFTSPYWWQQAVEVKSCEKDISHELFEQSQCKGRRQVTWTIYILVGTNHISGMADARVVRFCKHVGCIKSQHKYDKSPLKGAWSFSRDPFFYILPHIFVIGEPRFQYRVLIDTEEYVCMHDILLPTGVCSEL